MSVSSIEWTDRTWNPVRGCSRVSEGCRNCYAERVAGRFARLGMAFDGFAYDNHVAGINGKRRGWTGRVELIPEKLSEPLRWRKPQRVFVNSMSDLFHEALPDEAIDRVFAVMAMCDGQHRSGQHHTFQILTKRADRMRRYFADPETAWRIHSEVVKVNVGFRPSIRPADANGYRGLDTGQWPLPLPNVWLGVSVEDQKTADERIPLLLQTPAAVRFVSYEPALGPVDFGLSSVSCSCCPRPAHRWVRVVERVSADFPFLDGPRSVDAGIYRAASNPHGALSVNGLGIKPAEFERLPGLDWIIVGGESGPGARPFDVAWARSTVEQCRAAGVACFVKQLGAGSR